MNTKQLLNLIENPEQLNQNSMDDLLKLLIKYPYFQTAHLMLLKILANTNSPDLQTQMPYRAVYVADRQKMFKLLHAPANYDTPKKQTKENTETDNRKPVTKKELAFSEDSLNFHQSIVQELYFKSEKPIREQEQKNQTQEPEKIKEPSKQQTAKNNQAEEVPQKIKPEDKPNENIENTVLTAADLIKQSKKGTQKRKTVENVSVSKEILSKVNELRTEKGLIQTNKQNLETSETNTIVEPTNETITEQTITEETPEKKETETVENPETNTIVEPTNETITEQTITEETPERKETETVENPETKTIVEPTNETITEQTITEETPERKEESKQKSEIVSEKKEQQIEDDTKKTAADTVFQRIAALKKKKEIPVSENTQPKQTTNDAKQNVEGANNTNDKKNTEQSKETENQLNNLKKNTTLHSQKQQTEQTEQPIQKTKIKRKKVDLINKFIKESPSAISNKKEVSQQDVSTHSVVERPDFMTEKMATIYIQQSYFDKAIDVYEKLILKYPEKKAYFANQIQEIKNKIATK